MQGKANAPQEALAFQQLIALGFGQKTKCNHFIERRCTEVTARNPQNGVNIAQAAGAAFDIRFQIVAGAVIAQMAFVLLFNFGAEEVGRRPESVAENVFLHAEEQRNIAANQTRFNKIGGDGEIRQPFQQAFFQRANAVPDFQLHVPEQGDQFTDALRLFIIKAFLAQYQHIDVGKRV